MWKRSETDSRRVIIVDVSGLFYKYAYGNFSLSTTVQITDEYGRTSLETIDTTIPSGVIKQIHRWTNGGINPTVVCFDSLGCSNARKGYFRSLQGGVTTASTGYKGSRHSQNDVFYKSTNITKNLLIKGGVMCLSGENFEADDLIKVAVDEAKKQYPDLPIDVITGDQDLVPLVDEQVSVFISSKRTTYATDKAIEKKNYFQLRPENMQDYMEKTTEFKNLKIPYNTVLLKKLLRGKKADDVPGFPKFTPTKFNKLIEDMQNDGVDLSYFFRYEEPNTHIFRIDNNSEISSEEAKSFDKSLLHYSFDEPKRLTEMCEMLSKYLTDDQILHIKAIYNGVNLNGSFVNPITKDVIRKPAKLINPIKGYSDVELGKSCAYLSITLPNI